MPDAPREDGAGRGGTRGPAESAEGRRESVESTQDTQGRCGISQQDGRAGEPDDHHETFHHQDQQEDGVSEVIGFDEGREGGYEVDQGEDQH